MIVSQAANLNHFQLHNSNSKLLNKKVKFYLKLTEENSEERLLHIFYLQTTDSSQISTFPF